MSDILSVRDARRLRAALTVRDATTLEDILAADERTRAARTFTERSSVEPRMVRTARLVRGTVTHFGLGALLFTVMAVAMMKLGPVISDYLAEYAPQF